jgi:Fe2+ transport system protein B
VRVLEEESDMIFLVKREIFVLFRIVASCLTAVALIFFISSLSGEDLLKNNTEIKNSEGLISQINSELEGGIAQRLAQLGEVPEKNPFRRFYAIELAKEVHDLSSLTEKQRMLFDAYNVRSFESQLKRMMGYTENSDVKSLMDELEVVKRELKNSANLIDKKRKKLVRQRTAYIVLFVIFWILLYLYYSRGIIFKKSVQD